MKLRSGLIVAAILAAPVASASSAFAHAALESTIPAKGEIVGKSTKLIELVFGEEILVIKGKNPNSISVINPQGKLVSIGAAQVSGMKISEALKSPLIAGRYRVNYRVVSADGHVVSGSYNFSVK